MLGLLNHVGARWGLAWAWRLLALAPWLALAVGLALGAWAGSTLGRAPLLLELARLQQAQAQAAQQQAQASAQQLLAAQQRADTLYQRLAASQRQRQRLTQEKHHALTLATTGRPCLDATALGLLEHASGLSVEQPRGLPAAPGGAAAADQRFATDTDIGTWAVAAGAHFEACRERLDALIDWHRTPPQPPHLPQQSPPP